MDEGPLSAGTYTAKGAFTLRSHELNETFIRVAATRRESIMLRAAAEELRAESSKLKLTAARLTSRPTRLKPNGSSAPILREKA